MNVLCSLWNDPFHRFKCWGFCLTDAIFNYTESSILLWSNGVYYSSKWHQSATIFPRANYSTLLSFQRSSSLHVQRYSVGTRMSCQFAQKDRTCHQDPLIIMACNGLLTATLTMTTDGAVTSRQVHWSLWNYYMLCTSDMEGWSSYSGRLASPSPTASKQKS